MTIDKLNIEYETTFSNIDVDKVRRKIEETGGRLVKAKFNQKRTIFNFPKGHRVKGGYLRIRDEGDRITMTLKVMQSNGSIEGQKETELIINNYNKAVNLLKIIGAEEKAVQETKREIWEIDGVEIMIDWWPFLNPIIEIEGKNELEVRKVSEKLGFTWQDAIFDSIDYVYSKRYNISADVINNDTPRLIFNMKNPFIKNK